MEKLLPVCLEELFAQSFQDFDILIVDDCSPDGTADIIRQYADNYPDIIRAVCLPENSGSPARTRNVAMDSVLIDGKYVVFLDGDDSIEPNFLERLHSTATSTGADICVCGYDRVEGATGHVLCQEMQGFPDVITLPPYGDILAFANTSLWNKLIRSQLVSDIRIPDFKVGEDLCFLYKIYERCHKISFINDILIHYRVWSSSVISNTSQDTIHSFALQLETLMNDPLKQNMRELLELTSFIHIAISMALRAYSNPGIDISKHLAWTRDYLKRNGLLKSHGFLSFRSLIKYGLKGIGIWCCRILYQLRCMQVFLFIFNFVTKTLKFDIKF